MSLGLAGISVSPHAIPPPPPGPPFVATSADNGLSVDPGTGRIVLGNDLSFTPGTAQLLSNREVFTNGFNFRFTNTNLGINDFTNIIDASSIQILGLTSPNAVTLQALDAGASILVNSVVPVATPPAIQLRDGSANGIDIKLQTLLFKLTDFTGDFFQGNTAIGCYVNIPVPSGFSKFGVLNLPAFANNAAAVLGGLIPGEFYRISAAGTSAVAVVQ